MKRCRLAVFGLLALAVGAVRAEQVTVFGPWLGEDQEHVEAVLEAFAQRSGHDVRYAGSDAFEQQIMVDMEAGSGPSVAVFPQPGLAAGMAARGFLTPLAAGSAGWIREHYAAGDSWVDLGSFPDPDGVERLFGFFFKIDVKSLVWYSPENFADAGYAVPRTMEELEALSERIVREGYTPWCIGLGSGSATGWPATDWVEDLLLRTQPPKVYDGWVDNSIPFDDPRIVGAIEKFGTFARNDAWVTGGAGAVASTDFRDSPKALFSSPPQCYMHHQGSFIPSFFPNWAKVGLDADVFYFPAYANKDLGKPVLGAGTLWAITKPSQGAHDLIRFLRDPRAHEIWMARKGFLTPHKGVDPNKFSDATLRKMNDILRNATTFRFDGSDLMPGGVGSGAFWTGMVDYAAGKPADDVARAIQQAWDALK